MRSHTFGLSLLGLSVFGFCGSQHDRPQACLHGWISAM